MLCMLIYFQTQNHFKGHMIKEHEHVTHCHHHKKCNMCHILCGKLFHGTYKLKSHVNIVHFDILSKTTSYLMSHMKTYRIKAGIPLFGSHVA